MREITHDVLNVLRPALLRALRLVRRLPVLVAVILHAILIVRVVIVIVHVMGVVRVRAVIAVVTPLVMGTV